MGKLSVLLAFRPEQSVVVTCILEGAGLDHHEVLAQVPNAIAGAPTVALDEADVFASDDLGLIPLELIDSTDEDGDPVRCWTVTRPTTGRITYRYLARPTADDPQPATPPLELRAEGPGLSGALKCFVLLPPGPEDLPFDLQWTPPPGDASAGWMAVCSLGETTEASTPLEGQGLERLGDTYFVAGELRDKHLREGQLSTWWLTPPGIDLDAFSARLGATYVLMSRTFDVDPGPYRVFLRAHPNRGANGSAHPASFVMAMNPSRPLDVGSVYETLAHELVHEWLHLDGTEAERTWFNEGGADYYSLVVPLRAGLLDQTSFLAAVNLAARECYANPRRALSIQRAQDLFFSDFMAHRLPYARGMLYLADLDARLRRETAGQQAVDDLVRGVVRDREAGRRVGIAEWCHRVEQVLGTEEMPRLDALVFTGEGRPSGDAFGREFRMETIGVPVPDFGFDPSTLVSGRVRGLVHGGPAERAGLEEGDEIELPRYPDIMRMGPEDELVVTLTRDSLTQQIAMVSQGDVVAVPQWRPA